MEQSNKLYPLKFVPVEREHEWGKESFLLADLAEVGTMVRSGWLGSNSVSELMETYLEDIVGEASFNYYGLQFPVTVRGLDVEGRMPLVVTTDDRTAAARYDAFGKSVFWYVAETSPKAEIRVGFEDDRDASSLIAACEKGNLSSMLRRFKPSKGDCFEIRPGLVHGASGKMKIIEISEASDLDFQVADSDGFTGEHLAEALDLIDYSAGTALPVQRSEKDGVALLADIPEFKVSELRLDAPVRIEGGPRGTFSVYYCLSGGIVVKAVDGSSKSEEGLSDTAVRKGELVLVPAGLGDFLLAPSAEDTFLLEVIAGNREEPDSYLLDEQKK